MKRLLPRGKRRSGAGEALPVRLLSAVYFCRGLFPQSAGAPAQGLFLSDIRYPSKSGFKRTKEC